MSEDNSIKLFKAAKELNIGIGTIVEFLGTKGFSIENKPTTKLNNDMYQALLKEFQVDKIIKEEAKQINIGKIRREDASHQSEKSDTSHNKDVEQEEILIKNAGTFTPPPVIEITPEPTIEVETAEIKSQENQDEQSLPGVKIVGKINLDDFNKKTRPDKKKEEPAIEDKPEAAAVPESIIEEQIKEEPKEEIPVIETPVEPSAIEEILPSKAAEEEKEIISATKKDEEPAENQSSAPKEELPNEAVNIPAVEAEITPLTEAAPEDEVIRAKAQRLSGPNVIGKIQLPVAAPKRNPVASSSNAGGSSADHKRKRKRKENAPGQQQQQTQGQGGQQQPRSNQAGGPQANRPGGNRDRNAKPDFHKGKHHNAANTTPKEEPSEKDIQDQIKATLARLSGAGKSGKFAQRAKLRRQKRDDYATSAEAAALEEDMQAKVLKVTEFVTANELASMMDVSVTQIISTCMSLGMFVSINQRLDAETLTIVADEFGYEVDFVKPQDEEAKLEEEDAPEDLIPRAPIVTIMGHVDHGKTSLLDFIRKTNVIKGEAGGITQHIGAYEVTLDDGRKITFQDTPGHEAFTAMRARGAKVTDIVIIVIAADDSVMPQTKEAINHAMAAGVPLIFAFNKIDKPGANAEKIREQLAQMNILVEEWGGKYQTQEISAKSGLNIDLLLEKVLLEAELLDLKANPNKRASGTVIEAALDKGRGIVTTILVQSGTLRVGDPILAGCFSGRVKALTNERGQRVDKAGPSTPVQVLGMQGAPTAGDKFNAMESEVEAREIANKRMQLQREQGLRTQKHITLDEIGRRLAIGNFKELNIIVKGDVDGSIEAIADSLLKLSTDQIQVNIISKGVGQISESDVLLASASDAIIIGFQVRPSSSARKLAEHEQIDIRLYSIIYDAINEIKAAMEGMLEPKFEEKITANVEIRETFKISKVGTIAGCMVLDGKINRNSKIRIVRDGVVVFTGELASLKRFKDDVKEVSTGYECGLNIQGFNDIKVGDIVEAYENVEVKRKL
jgi:translation initiation factor IF-2